MSIKSNIYGVHHPQTCTCTHRYRLVAGRGRSFDGLYSTKPHGGKTHGFSMLQWRCKGAGGRFPSIDIEIEGQEGAGGRFLPPALKSRGRRKQEWDPSHQCQNRGAWVQEGDHILPASKSRGARVLKLRGALPVLSIVSWVCKMREWPLLNLKMWPTTKIISIHTYIIERNTYVGGMGGSTIYFPFPSPSLSLCLYFWKSCWWWLVFWVMAMAVMTLLARVEKDRKKACPVSSKSHQFHGVDGWWWCQCCPVTAIIVVIGNGWQCRNVSVP